MVEAIPMMIVETKGLMMNWIMECIQRCFDRTSDNKC